jgi:hypothetical protein
MARILGKLGFDLAGVQAHEAGPVIGFVTRDLLNDGLVSDHRQPLTAEHLISDATSLPLALEVLRKKTHVFVLVGPEVRGIVTRADLNKPPVRVYLFGVISLLEMHLGFWIRHHYGNNSWQAELTSDRREKAMKIQVDRQAQNQETDLLDCTEFCDKRVLVVGSDPLRETLGLGQKRKAIDLLKRAESLRNLLAHSQQDLVEGSSWEEVIDLVSRVETVVQRSDDHVEQEVRKSAGKDVPGLWASA